MGCYNYSRLGFISFDENYAQNIIVKYEEEKDWRVLDFVAPTYLNGRNNILTIGDSFSEKRKGSYSNFLAHKIDSCVVLNMKIKTDNPFVDFQYLLENKNIPNVIIVESVERTLIQRLLELDFGNSVMPDSKFVAEEEITAFSFDKLIKRTVDYYKILTLMKGNRPIRHLKLSKEAFSCKKNESELYFFYEEINIKNSKEEIEIAAQKMDSLFMFANERGVTLLVLIAADVYDVYQDLIVDNIYPYKTMLDDFSSRINTPYYINTKDLFKPYVEKGIKDIYWCTDSHWSPVGAKIVSDEIVRRLDSLGIL